MSRFYIDEINTKNNIKKPEKNVLTIPKIKAILIFSFEPPIAPYKPVIKPKTSKIMKSGFLKSILCISRFINTEEIPKIIPKTEHKVYFQF